MERLFESITLGAIKLENRFIFPPIKLGYGNPDGSVSDRQLTFYGQIAQKGPGREDETGSSGLGCGFRSKHPDYPGD